MPCDPADRDVKLSPCDYTRSVGKYVTGKRKRFRPHKVYILLIRITSRVDLAMSVCPSVLMTAEISETIRATILGLGMQIAELPAQSPFVSAMCQCATPTNHPKLWLLQF